MCMKNAKRKKKSKNKTLDAKGMPMLYGICYYLRKRCKGMGWRLGGVLVYCVSHVDFTNPFGGLVLDTRTI